MTRTTLLHPVFSLCVVGLLSLGVAVGCSEDSAEPAATGDVGSVTPAGTRPGDLPDDELARQLEGFANQQDLPMGNRVGAVMAIGTLSEQEAVAPLVRLLSSSEPQIVVAAVEALPDARDPAVMEALRGLLSQPDASVRDAAEARLKRLE